MSSRILSESSRVALLDWYELNRRDLPWRRSKDAYAIWVSEAMLQQTQVATVRGYWQRWMERFPTLESLAAADEQEVLAIWQGLGYYRRCRMLLQGARSICDDKMPRSANEWKQVPGVGPYTAAAISSIAFDEPAALVDGNVERVYSRLAGDPTLPPALSTQAWQWARTNLYANRPGDWNQALMELGATVCRPDRPQCDACPLEPVCEARQSGTTDALPSRATRPETIHLKQVVWVPICEGQFGVRQIPMDGWWHGMWEFPRVNDAKEPALDAIVNSVHTTFVGAVRHSVTRHRIRLNVFLATCERKAAGLKWVSEVDLQALPMPAPQRKSLALVQKHLTNERDRTPLLS